MKKADKNKSTLTKKAASKQKKKPSLLSKNLVDEKWSQIQKDMSKAINYWDDIAKRYEGKPNHDEQQMQEIKKLLKDLQKKLTHFN